jgi:D-tyrosyl-tRNA(Tyr) deacylase
VRAVIQRVSWARVEVAGQIVGAIGPGLTALIGVAREDVESDARLLADKLLKARIFEDEAGKMNHSVLDTGGQLLLISQFTLLGDLRKGRRPSFTQAMEPESARILFERFCAFCRESELVVQTGVFRAQMEVSLCNSGPVTLLFDSRREF